MRYLILGAYFINTNKWKCSTAVALITRTKNNIISYFHFIVPKEKYRGGYLLCFLDDGDGMDPSKTTLHNVGSLLRNIVWWWIIIKTTCWMMWWYKWSSDFNNFCCLWFFSWANFYSLLSWRIFYLIKIKSCLVAGQVCVNTHLKICKLSPINDMFGVTCIKITYTCCIVYWFSKTCHEDIFFRFSILFLTF